MVWCAVFHSKLNNNKKSQKLISLYFFNVFGHFWEFFEVKLVLYEKLRTKPKEFISMKNFDYFDTHVAPKLAIIVDWMKYFLFLLVWPVLTVLAKAVLTRPSVCSKSVIFREAWHILNLQPCPCPLEALIPHIRAFKWCI